jgi:hypothetical protein
MADQKRGHGADAARELVPARHTIESYFETPQLPAWQQGYWYDWLFARFLLREATAVVEGRVESSSGSSIRK